MNSNNICKTCDGTGKLITNKDNITSIKICNNCNGEKLVEFGEPIYMIADSYVIRNLPPNYVPGFLLEHPMDVLLGIKNPRIIEQWVDSRTLKF